MASSGNFANNNILIRPVGGTLVTDHSSREISSTSGSWGAPTTMAANTGKWYIEYYVNAGSSGRNVMVVPTNSDKYNQGNYNFPATGTYGIVLNSNGSIYNNDDSTATQSGLTALQTGDIMAMALNLDASPKTLQYYRNGTAIGTAENINTSATGHFAFMIMGHNQSTMTINAGQDSSFAGAKSTGTANAADDNGFGNFYYTPPSGFLSMCSGNLPVSANIDPAQTDDDYPSKQFNTVLYTGNGNNSRSVTGVGFKPDLIWGKIRSATNSSFLYDSSRGSNVLRSDTADAEADYSSYWSQFDSDGWTFGSNASSQNVNTGTFVTWCWRANGGTTSTNTSGTITSTVQANQAAGFSIVLYTGESATRTVGHGLNAVPNFIIFKSRGGTRNWGVYHTDTGLNMVTINRTNAADTGAATNFGNTIPTSSVFTIGDGSETGKSENYVAYCWHDVEGYSKFGKFEGNSNADGPFVYTGFRPRLVFVKSIDATENWQVRDTARHSNTGSQTRIYWNSSAAEGTASTASPIDFLANGFKVRGSNSEINTNTLIYGAWGDVPFKYNNTL